MAQGRIYRTGSHAQNIRFGNGRDWIRSRHARRAGVCEPDFTARQCEASHAAEIVPASWNAPVGCRADGVRSQEAPFCRSCLTTPAADISALAPNLQAIQGLEVCTKNR